MDSDHSKLPSGKDLVRKREQTDDPQNQQLKNKRPNIRKVGELANKYKIIYGNCYFQAYDFKGCKSVDIVQIKIARDILAALFIDGLVVLLSRNTGELVGELDLGCVSELHYNKYRSSLITVIPEAYSITGSATFTDTPIQSFYRQTQVNKSTVLFKSESDITCWDFDIDNCKGMIYNCHERVFKVYGLRNYHFLYKLQNETYYCTDFGFQSSANSKMVMFNRRNKENWENRSLRIKYDTKNEGHDNVESQNPVNNDIIPLKLLSKEDGTQVKQMMCPVHPGEEIQYLVLCGESHILLKQKGRGIEIVDISSSTVPKINATNIETGCTAPVFLHKKQLFLAFFSDEETIKAFTLLGQLVISFQDHYLSLFSFRRTTYITEDQNVIISVCGPLDAEDFDSINLSSICTGECLLKINSKPKGCANYSDHAFYGEIQGLAYDEKTYEIFTGNSCGYGGVWSSQFIRERALMDNCLPPPQEQVEELQNDETTAMEEDEEEGEVEGIRKKRKEFTLRCLLEEDELESDNEDGDAKGDECGSEDDCEEEDEDDYSEEEDY